MGHQKIVVKNRSIKSPGVGNHCSNLPKMNPGEARVCTSTALWWPWGTLQVRTALPALENTIMQAASHGFCAWVPWQWNTQSWPYPCSASMTCEEVESETCLLWLKIDANDSLFSPPCIYHLTTHSGRNSPSCLPLQSPPQEEVQVQRFSFP